MGTLLRNRYKVARQYDQRGTVFRFHGLHQQGGASEASPVVIVQDRGSGSALVAELPHETVTSEVGQSQARSQASQTHGVAEGPAGSQSWPCAAWESDLLRKLDHPFFPKLVEFFSENGVDYLVEERPVGQPFWDMWDDAVSTDRDRFDWLRQIAEGLDQLHRQGAIVEELRPESLVVGAGGQVRLVELSGLIPLPPPADVRIRASCYTAPELIFSPGNADARADLFGFGAMLYALHLGRELTELDFELQGVPKPVLRLFPEVHPDLGRVIGKTFCREPSARFPTEEANEKDPSGFRELIDVLIQCGRSAETISLEIGAWTTTGMVRTDNEDAFAVYHLVGCFENNPQHRALVFQADGMGGHEAGEVAARMAILTAQKYLSSRQPFAGLFLRDPGEKELSAPSAPADPESYKEVLAGALREANTHVYEFSRRIGRERMGCTAELVYISGRDVLVAHVGDSRTYHLQGGRLVQVTRDQTSVNRMVDMGLLTPEEAENHPRQSELCQAIGGRPEVEPSVHHCRLNPGDWLLVCTDGLTNQVPPEAIKDALLSARSAESAARRLVNFANFRGATDNVTVVVVRAG
jgi:protein phosphatase